MTRDDVRAQLSAYLDGELGEAERRAVEAALAAQPALRAELARLRRTADLVRALPRAAAPATLAPRVHAAIQEALEPAAPRRWLLTGWRPAALAAAACLILGIVTFLATRPPAPREGARLLEPVQDQEALDRLHAPAKPGSAVGGYDDGRLAGRQAPADALAPAEDLARRKADKFAANAIESERARARADGAGRAGAPAAAPTPEPREEARHVAADELAERALELKKAKALADAERQNGWGDRPKQFAEPGAPRPAVGAVIAKGAGAAPAPAPSIEKAAETAFAPEAAPAILARGAADGKHEAEEILAEAKLRRTERDELLASIERKAPLASAAKPLGQAPHRTMGAAGGAPPAAVAGGERRLELRLPYDDLFRCLADVQAALAAADASYALQPVGDGQFVVETTLPEPQARAVVARLTRPARDRDLAKEQGGGTGAARKAVKAEAPAEAAGGEAVAVRLVLRFARAAEATRQK